MNKMTGRAAALLMTAFVAMQACNNDENTDAVTGITLSPTTASVVYDSTFTITADVQPSTAANKEVEWSSDRPSVAVVNASGVVTAQNERGTAIITATTKDGRKTATCTVNVFPRGTSSTDMDSIAGAQAAATFIACLTNAGNNTLAMGACVASLETSRLTNLSWMFAPNATIPDGFNPATLTAYEKGFYAAMAASGLGSNNPCTDCSEQNRQGEQAANDFIACGLAAGENQAALQACAEQVTPQLPNLSWMFNGENPQPPANFDPRSLSDYELGFFAALMAAMVSQNGSQQTRQGAQAASRYMLCVIRAENPTTAGACTSNFDMTQLPHLTWLFSENPTPPDNFDPAALNDYEQGVWAMLQAAGMDGEEPQVVEVASVENPSTIQIDNISVDYVQDGGDRTSLVMTPFSGSGFTLDLPSELPDAVISRTMFGDEEIPATLVVNGPNVRVLNVQIVGYNAGASVANVQAYTNIGGERVNAYLQYFDGDFVVTGTMDNGEGGNVAFEINAQRGWNWFVLINSESTATYRTLPLSTPMQWEISSIE